MKESPNTDYYMKKFMKEAGAEEPSPGFTDDLMRALPVRKFSAQFAGMQVISRKAIVLIVSSFVILLLIPVIFGGSAAGTGASHHLELTFLNNILNDAMKLFGSIGKEMKSAYLPAFSVFIIFLLLIFDSLLRKIFRAK